MGGVVDQGPEAPGRGPARLDRQGPPPPGQAGEPDEQAQPEQRHQHPLGHVDGDVGQLEPPDGERGGHQQDEVGQRADRLDGLDPLDGVVERRAPAPQVVHVDAEGADQRAQGARPGGGHGELGDLGAAAYPGRRPPTAARSPRRRRASAKASATSTGPSSTVRGDGAGGLDRPDEGQPDGGGQARGPRGRRPRAARSGAAPRRARRGRRSGPGRRRCDRRDPAAAAGVS